VYKKLFGKTVFKRDGQAVKLIHGAHVDRVLVRHASLQLMQSILKLDVKILQENSVVFTVLFSSY
jgi:hypothetical protein